VFENKLLRRVFGPKRIEVTGDWRKLHNEELHNINKRQNTAVRGYDTLPHHTHNSSAKRQSPIWEDSLYGIIFKIINIGEPPPPRCNNRL
jgi:hypothetical protein